MKCDCGSRFDVDAVAPADSEAVGLRVRRLLGIKMKRIAVWSDE